MTAAPRRRPGWELILTPYAIALVLSCPASCGHFLCGEWLTIASNEIIVALQCSDT